MKGQPLVPTLEPSESGSISHVAESTGAELPSELAVCRELPSAAGPTTVPAGSPSSVLWDGPQIVEAPGTEMPSPNNAPGRAVSDTPEGPRAVTVPMASQADVTPLLEGRANVGMALEVSPSSIPQEITTVMSPVSLTAPLQAMGASGDPQPNGSATGRAMGMGFLEVSTEENRGASAAAPTPSHVIVTARPSPEPRATEDKPTAGITSLTVGHANVQEATAASWTGTTGTTAHVEPTHSESSTEGAAPSASTSSTHGPDSNATGTSLATLPATTPSTSTFPSNANLPPTSTGWEAFVTRVTTAMPPATAGATSTSSAPSLAVTHSETSREPATSLYPFGVEGGDQEYVRRMVDFNSPLFKPEIGFPFGKSLRDALYFTDNGQIIFPPTDNYVPSNPNPPPWGFTGRESLPMVAAFWDDADFSKGVGTTWYQEYSTLSSTQNPVVQDVEAKIENYLKIPYVAKWTLKVTWDKAPAYPSRRDDTQTSTYQAVLTTDGNRSFALLLYQDGGMRWDYTKLAAANVLIGFSSGNGYAQNSKLTQKPPAVKYRPDQYSSAGSDVRGLWIYRLDSRSRVNYRLQCLAWLDTEPAPATWNSQLPPCPCSRPQAELDPRYHWSRGAEDTPQDQLQGVGMVPSCAGDNHDPPTISDPEDSSVRMLRTASPSPAGAGVRCLYQGGSLLEGWQERTWSFPFHTATAGAFGDPHITTLDGLTYTFNGLGDFVLLLASDAQTSFALHGRTAQTGMAQATNFVAFAAQYISNTTTTVEWTLGSQDDIQVLLNNETILFSYSQDLGDEVYYSPGVLLVNASSVTAVFDGSVAVSVSATSGMLSVVCSLPAWYRNSTRGLLGVWDHDPADDFQMPNGTSIPVNSSEEEIYSYGMTWAVGEHSLFAQPLNSPALTFTPFFLSRLRQENESQYQLAASQCHGSKECIYDSLSTGNLALGLATQSLAADFQQRKTALNAFPPVITGDTSITTFRTEKVRRQYHALGVGARFIPHLSPELNISDIDECAQGMECPENSTCTNTVGSYVCSCLDSEQGERPGCGSACGYHSCPEGYCSNGGHCHLHPITCTPTCTCPPAFTDQRCQVSAILDSLEVKAFQSNTNITQMTDSDGFTFVVVSEFAYDSHSIVIHFLNEELPAAITGAFNGRRRRRETGTGLLFQHLYQDNITDLVKLTVDELRDYFPCSLNGYKGYQLHYVGTIGFICISPCKMGYCQHGGQCQHLPEGPTCSCLPFSIYSPAGAQCQWLAISLAAFLGILLGALALLCLLFAIACLALHLCRQHRRQHRGAKETLWRTRPFSYKNPETSHYASKPVPPAALTCHPSFSDISSS
ncbi:mucin 4, cell surface associated [Turdus rufiventris]|nr:mucin 4, cell surface associated [Turdus rufiventris]